MFLGKRALKNVPKPLKLHKILLEGENRRIRVKTIYYSHMKTINGSIVTASFLIIILLLYFFSPFSRGFTQNKVEKIAVLPFENRQESEEFEYLSEGLAEDVIGKLFNLSSVTVISSRSSFQFKNTNKSLVLKG